MRTSRAEPHSLVGAYALDALAGKDLVRFERHLTSCARCAERLRTLREAAACLGACAVIEPPPALADRAIAAAARTPQLPAPGRIPRVGRPRATSRVAVVAAGIAVIAAGFLGAAERTAVNSLSEQESRARAIAAVLVAADATVLKARVATGGRATIIMSARQHVLVFTAISLARVPSSERYELWLMGPSGDRPAGMLSRAASDGMTGPVLARGLRPGDRLCLTLEPSGGSSRPNSTVLLAVPL
jgi:anti-sigma-K factor RskA